jgi:PLP dependent protein
MSIAENIAELRQRIEAAARRGGRNAESVTLMAVTKTVSADRIQDAYGAGIRVFGENRVQEFSSKAAALASLQSAEWHMIGHLQSNKARDAVELFAAMDSIDSVRLMQKVNALAQQAGKKIPVLIEINIGGEAAKSGVSLHSAELPEMLKAAPSCEALDVAGLMAVPPYDNNPERSRPYFRNMRALWTSIAERKLPGLRMSVLSMGMSHDYEVAIEEGATCVRIGNAIFGERPPARGWQ